MRQYSLNYEEGKCAFGYEFVPSHISHRRIVNSYRRIIPSYRFSNPDLAIEREERRTESRIRREMFKDDWMEIE